MLLGTFPLRMVNKFISVYFRSRLVALLKWYEILQKFTKWKMHPYSGFNECLICKQLRLIVNKIIHHIISCDLSCAWPKVTLLSWQMDLLLFPTTANAPKINLSNGWETIAFPRAQQDPKSWGNNCECWSHHGKTD